jgi:hypothetical protein
MTVPDDRLLKIPNPAHAEFNRLLTGGESRAAARIAEGKLHCEPDRLE